MWAASDCIACLVAFKRPVGVCRICGSASYCHPAWGQICVSGGRAQLSVMWLCVRHASGVWDVRRTWCVESLGACVVDVNAWLFQSS